MSTCIEDEYVRDIFERTIKNNGSLKSRKSENIIFNDAILVV